MKKLYLLLIGLILTSCSSFDTYTYDELEIFEENINVTINGTNIPFRVQGLRLQRMGEGWAWPALGNNFREELTEEYDDGDEDLDKLKENIVTENTKPIKAIIKLVVHHKSCLLLDSLSSSIVQTSINVNHFL